MYNFEKLVLINRFCPFMRLFSQNLCCMMNFSDGGQKKRSYVINYRLEGNLTIKKVENV